MSAADAIRAIASVCTEVDGQLEAVKVPDVSDESLDMLSSSGWFQVGPAGWYVHTDTVVARAARLLPDEGSLQGDIDKEGVVEFYDATGELGVLVRFSYEPSTGELAQTSGACDNCDDFCDGDAVPGFVVDDAWLCLRCRAEAAEETGDEAKEWAAEHVKLTGKPHQFDPSGRSAPTPQEYDAGQREAYTANSVRASNRHRCTNYDEVLRSLNLDRDDPFDQVKYHAIRARAEELVEEALLGLDEDDDDDDLEDDDDDDDLEDDDAEEGGAS